MSVNEQELLAVITNKIWVDADRFSIAVDGVIRPTQVHKCIAQIVVTGGETGVGLNGFGKQLYGVVRVSGLSGDHPQQVIGVGMIGRCVKNLFIGGFCFG